MLDVIIIGGGPAGLSAAIYAERAGLKTAVIEKAVAGGQISQTHKLENYLGFENGISGADFAAAILAQAKRFGGEFILDEVTDLELEGDVKKVITKGAVYETRSVILAMGVSPRKLEIPGEQELSGMGVSYCATCDGAFFRGLPVAVVGGGDTAFEDALYLSEMASDVYLIHRRDAFRAQEYLVKLAEARSNIHFVKETVPVEIQGRFEVEGLKVRNVRTEEESILDVAGVFVAAGHIPGTDLLKGKVDLDSHGYVIASENTKTNIDNVFVAGDVRTKSLRQVVAAASDGAIAAMEAHANIKLK